MNGVFSSIFTLNPIFTITSGIYRGDTYRLRYRAVNFNGWSNFSGIAYIQAATAPSIPPAPVYVSSTATSITLLILPPLDNGGSVITSYNLWIDTLQIIPSYIIAY